MHEHELYHHGILGQKWGVRRFQNKDGSLTTAGKNRYAEISDKKIITNSDGSKTYPKGYVFNRVGQSTLDINSSGALYVSSGKQDAARYVKSLGPTLIGKLMGQYGTTVQHITSSSNLKVPSDDQVSSEVIKLLSSNKKLRESVNDSIYAMVLDKDITDSYLNKSKNSLKDSAKLSYVVSSLLADPQYVSESKIVYDHFRKLGYDAIPDSHDIMSGTSETAMIIINPSKVNMTSSTAITKDVMKEAKSYVKTLDKLKVSELIQ